jgi:hypothetical protein
VGFSSKAIAAAGSLEAILAAMKEREARRAHLEAELERLESRAKIRSSTRLISLQIFATARRTGRWSAPHGVVSPPSASGRHGSTPYSRWLQLVYDWLDANQELELENRDERLNLVS